MSRVEHLEILQKIWTLTDQSISRELRDYSLYQAAVLSKSSTVDWLLDKCSAIADATSERPQNIFANYPNASSFPDFLNALNAAASSGNAHIVRSLIKHGAIVEGPSVYALQLAASEGHAEVVEILLKHGALVNKQVVDCEELGFFNGTALQAACDNRRSGTVETLLKHGANPNLGGGPFVNPITAATQMAEPGILKQLLGAGNVDVNVTGGEDLSTPLINAATYMSADSIKLLIECGADVDAKNVSGETALIIAAGRGDMDCIELLCNKGADMAYRSPHRGLAIGAAADGQHPLCVRLLADKMGASIDHYREQVKIDPSKNRVTEIHTELELRYKHIDHLEATLADTKEQLESAKRTISLRDHKLRIFNTVQGGRCESLKYQIRVVQSERMEMQKQLDASREQERLANEALERVAALLQAERERNAALSKHQESDALQENGGADSDRTVASPLTSPHPGSSSPQPSVPHLPVKSPESKSGFRTIHGPHRPDGSMGGYRKDRVFRIRSNDSNDTSKLTAQSKTPTVSPKSSVSNDHSTPTQ